MSLAALPLAVVLTVVTLTLTTPAATQEDTTQETSVMTTVVNPAENNCSDDDFYGLEEGATRHKIKLDGRQYRNCVCRGGALQCDEQDCKEDGKYLCADLTANNATNTTCVPCISLYQSCNGTLDETTTCKGGTIDDCLYNPLGMVKECCTECNTTLTELNNTMSADGP